MSRSSAATNQRVPITVIIITQSFIIVEFVPTQHGIAIAAFIGFINRRATILPSAWCQCRSGSRRCNLVRFRHCRIIALFRGGGGTDARGRI